MVTKLFSTLLVGTLLASPVLGRQEGEHPHDKAHKEVKTTTPATAEIEFSVAVKGLTKDNMAAVTSALDRIMVKRFECPECGHARDVAGECTGCGVELEETSHAAFTRVTPSVDKGTLALRLGQELYVRLTQIDKALQPSNVQVERDKLALNAPAMLVYTGTSSKEAAMELEKAFLDAKLTGARATADAKANEIHVRWEKGMPTFTVASELGSKLAKPLRLTDVVWGRMPTPKA